MVPNGKRIVASEFSRRIASQTVLRHSFFQHSKGALPVLQQASCIGDNPFNNDPCRQNIMDQAYGLSGNHSSHIKIPRSFSQRIFCGNGLYILEEFKLAGRPPAGMIIHKATAGKRRGPDIVARDIENETPDGDGASPVSPLEAKQIRFFASSWPSASRLA